MKKTMSTDKDNNDEMLETNNESDDDVRAWRIINLNF